MLIANDVMAQAEQRAGLADPEPELRRNLEALIEALNRESRLSEAGEQAAQSSLINRAAERIEAVRWLREHPEIGEEPISEPVFLTGLPRSGTTFFQYLFDRDRRFRLIRTWEARAPFPPPGYAPETVAQRLAEEVERRRARAQSVEGFAAMHLADADGPEECHAFLEQTCASAGFHNLYDVPSFFEYLLEAVDYPAVYRAHKRQLQLLQWGTPPARWALKYPNHVLAMPAIVEVYPDARFVMTHRDPVQTLASICKLTAALRPATGEGQVDPHHVGRQMLHFVRRHIDRILEFDAAPEGDRVIHVDYYALVENPAREMEKVHAGLGIDTPDDVRAAVRDWHERNPKGARGSNPYALETYGLDGDEVADFFADYMRRFDVPREQVGLGRTAHE